MRVIDGFFSLIFFSVVSDEDFWPLSPGGWFHGFKANVLPSFFQMNTLAFLTL